MDGGGADIESVGGGGDHFGGGGKGPVKI